MEEKESKKLGFGTKAALIIIPLGIFLGIMAYVLSKSESPDTKQMAVVIAGGMLALSVISFFAIAAVSNEKAITVLVLTSIVCFVAGLASTMAIIFTDDNDYSKNGPKDDYTYSPQYYKDAHDYYQKNPDKWNKDYGSKYGYH